MPDPFELLGLPRAFDLDPRALQSAYLKRSAALHPDRFNDPIEREEAQRAAAALNDARAALADDEQRANLMLAFHEGATKEQDKSLPDGFLMEILDVRQEMDVALAGGELPERERIEAWASERRQQHVEAVRAMFKSLETNPGPSKPATLDAIRRELNAWRYIERMIEQLRDA